ncbi:hypothetical protein P879_08326 [Paragonimus westermani]|uniref:NACHT domain-containing protein n=1 Tax=Paragonimus westermani TaxID=34504 RepID=A0A8T0DEC7_9TREM|nr:hypothetical protein P879_08326 [Paragonimus westermani]
MRMELSVLRVHVWPHLQRLCRSRGFTLHVIDHSMATDIDPPGQPLLDKRSRQQSLSEHMGKRNVQKQFLNSILLLSNRSVGPVPCLPPMLSNTTVTNVTRAAHEEIRALETEIEALSEKMYSATRSHTEMRQKRMTMSDNSMDGSQDHLERRTGSSYLRFDERALLAQVTPLEESIKQKTELAQALRPEPLGKWYQNPNKGTEKVDQMCYLQPVRNILPDIGRTDDLMRRQTALESWLNDAHHIRCLLLRYVNWPHEPTNEYSANFPMEQRRSTVTTTSSDCGPSVTKKDCEIGIKDLAILSQSFIEMETKTILNVTNESQDCLVVIRCHDDPPAADEQTSGTHSIQSRSVSMGSLTEQHRPSMNIMEPINTVYSAFTEAPFIESENRARKLIDYARLRVPQCNQIQHDVNASVNPSLEQRIRCTRPPLDPLDCQDHASYLEQICRDLKALCSQSLEHEMTRRLRTESRGRTFQTAVNKAIMRNRLWTLDASEFIGRTETLSDMIEWMNSEIQNREVEANNTEDPGGKFGLMIVNGASGSGKSVLLARLAAQLQEPNCLIKKPRVIYRSVGSSTLSMRLLDFLHYLSLELSTKMSPSTISDNYDGLRNAVHQALMEATYEQNRTVPLVIILDGTESLEEFIQRKADFPLSWLPTQWLQNHPRLNCDVFLIISATSKQDNKPFMGFGGMLDLIHITEQIGPSSCYKQVHLSPLSDWDKTVCVDTWTEEQYVGSKIPDSTPAQMVPDTINQPITLRLFTALTNSCGPSDGMANLKDCTLTALFHIWFAQAELQFGQARVQFVMRHLVSARWGLDDDDILTLYRQHVNMQLKSKSGVRMAHRQSIQAANLNQSLAIMLTHQPAVTSHWWNHFRNTYLIPTGLLGRRRNPPEGSSTLWYLRQQVVEGLIRLRYLDGPNRTMTYHTLADWCQQDMQSYNTTMPSSLGWRCLHELPVYLSKSDRKQRLRNACWFNPTWLKGLLYIALELRGVRGSIQRLLDEIAATLHYLYADKWEVMQSDLASQQTDIETVQMDTIDRHVPVLLKLISEDTELCQLLGALCAWKNQLRRDPMLINSLFYTQFYNRRTELESKSRDTPGEDQEGDMGIEVSVRRSDLRGLVDRIRSEPKSCTLQPVNFQLDATLGSLSLIGENLTSAVKQTSLCYSQIVINVDALAYTTDGNLLALAIHNIRTCVTKTEVWSLKSNVVCWGQVMETRSMNKICQLNWVSDHALLVVHSPSQVITLWPVEMSQSIAGHYWQLSDVVTNVHEEVSVRVVNTEVPELVFILILQLGLCRVNVWRWSYGTLEFVHSSVTLMDSMQMPNYQSPSNTYRHMSLPMVAKSSAELLFTAAVTDTKLQFVCAHKHETTARLTSFELTGKPLTLNFKCVGKQRMLKSPCKGTRIIAMETTERGPIVLASRAPSLELPGEPVVGCLDLFELSTGNFLNHIEAGTNVFAFAEAPSLGCGLLTQSTPNQLRLLLCKDGVNLITVAISSEKKNNQCFNKELIHWNLISRAYKLLDQSDLLSHISATPSELPAPLTTSICDISRLSLCFGTDAESRCLVWHCDPSHAIVRPAERSRRSTRTNPEMWQDLQTDSENPPRLFYLFRNPDQDMCLGLFQQVSDLQSVDDHVTFDSWYTMFTFPVIAHKKHSARWSATDRFILQGRTLVVLGKLGYSKVVEACK